MVDLDELLRTSEELTLETRGRRTGRPRRVQVWFAYEPPDLWLRTDGVTEWLRNLRAHPTCRILVGDRAADAELVAVHKDQATLQRLVERWRAKYGPEWVEDWYFEHGRSVVQLRLSTP